MDSSIVLIISICLGGDVVAGKAIRNPWFDNMKGLLILLVVFGHSIEVYRDIEGHSLTLYLYNLIYFFHMPLFIMISGYFFRANRYDRTIKLMIVYIIWQVLNSILIPFMNDGKWVTLTPDSKIWELFQPNWTMWYLLAIIAWSITTPYFLKFKYPLIIAVILAIWAGYTEDLPKWFSFRKLITFYPYFLIGYYLSNKNILTKLGEKTNSWKNPLKYVAVGIVLVGSFGMYLFTKGGYNTSILFMRDSYNYFDWSFFKGAFIHLFMYMIIIFFSVSLALLIPKKTPLVLINRFGVSSLFIYLVHTFFVRVYRHLINVGNIQDETQLIVYGAVFALLVCILLSTPFVQALLKVFISPNINGLLKKENKPVNAK